MAENGSVGKATVQVEYDFSTLNDKEVDAKVTKLMRRLSRTSNIEIHIGADEETKDTLKLVTKLDKSIQSLEKSVKSLSTYKIDVSSNKLEIAAKEVEGLEKKISKLAAKNVKLAVDSVGIDEAALKLAKLNGRKADVQVLINNAEIDAAEAKLAKLNGKRIDAKVQVDDSALNATEGKISRNQGKTISTKLDVDDSDLDKLDSKVKDTSDKGSAAMGAFAGSISTKFLGAAGVTALIGGSVNALGNFDAGVRQISTLLPNMPTKEFQKLKSDIIDMSSELGKSTDETIPALYDALSSGIPKEDVFSFVKNASKAATAGVTDTQTAVGVMTSILNVYGQENITAAEASDKLFVAVNRGVTTFPELAQSLGDVLPTAKSLGLTFGDTSAAIADLTLAGINTPKAVTALNSALSQLADPAQAASKAFEKVAGKTFPDFIKSGGSMTDALKLMKKGADGTAGGLNALFSIDGAKAINRLTDPASQFTSIVDDMGKSAGATEVAYNKMAGGFASKFGRMFQSAKTETLGFLDKTMTPLLDAGAGLATIFFQGDYTGGIFGLQEDSPAIDALFKIREGIIGVSKAIGMLFTGDFKGLSKMFDGMFDGFDPKEIGKKAADIVNSAGDWVLDLWTNMLDQFKNIDWNKVTDILVDGLDQVQTALLAGIGKVWDGLVSFVGNVDWGGLLTKWWQGLGDLFDGVGKMFKNIDWGKIADQMFDYFGDLVILVVKGLVKLIPMIGKIIANTDWGALAKSFFNGLVQAIELIFVDLPITIGEIIGAVIGKLGSVIGEWFGKVDWGDVGSTLLSGVVKLFELAFVDLPLAIWNLAWNSLKSAWDYLKDVDWSEVGYKVADGIIALFKFVWLDLPKKIFDVIWDGIKAVWDFLKDVDWGDVASKIGEAYLKLMKTVWIDLPSKLGSLAWDALKGAFKWVVENVGDLGSDLFDWFSKLPGKLVEAIGDIGSTIWSGVKKGFTFVKDKISGFIDGVVDFFKGFAQRVTEAIPLDKIKSALLKPINLAISGINTIIGGINKFLDILPGDLKIPTIPKVGDDDKKKMHSGGIVTADGAGAPGLAGDEVHRILQVGERVLPRGFVQGLTKEEHKALDKGDLSYFRGQKRKPETGWGIPSPGDVWDGVKKVAGKGVEVARMISSKAIEKILDQGIDAIKSAMKPFAESTPGKWMIKTGEMLKDKMVDYIAGVKDEGDKRGLMNLFGPDYGNATAQKVMKKVSTDALADVIVQLGKKNSYKALEKYMDATGTAHRVTSALREGSKTESGTMSLHAVGRAVDFAGVKPSKDSQQLADIFWSLIPIAPYLSELIYAGPQTDFNIKNLKKVKKYAQGIHHDHVHAALHTGGLVGRDGYPSAGVGPNERLHKLEVGEYVLQKDAVSNVGLGNLERMNEGDTTYGGDTFVIQGDTTSETIAAIQESQRIKRSKIFK